MLRNKLAKIKLWFYTNYVFYSTHTSKYLWAIYFDKMSIIPCLLFALFPGSSYMAEYFIIVTVLYFSDFQILWSFQITEEDFWSMRVHKWNITFHTQANQNSKTSLRRLAAHARFMLEWEPVLTRQPENNYRNFVECQRILKGLAEYFTVFDLVCKSLKKSISQVCVVSA